MGEISFSSFPRSGNHFVHFLIKEKLPKHKLNYLSHNAFYLNQNPNAFTTIRNPLECVTSWIANSKQNELNRAEKNLEWYINFYTTIEHYDIPVILFVDLISKPLDVMQHLCKIFDFEKLTSDELSFDENDLSICSPTPIFIKQQFPKIEKDVKMADNYNDALVVFNKMNEKCFI